MPSYQVDDAADLYWNMRDRDPNTLEQALTEGRKSSLYFFQILSSGLEKIFSDPRAKFGATKDQLTHFKTDLISATSENEISSYLRDFIRLYR